MNFLLSFLPEKYLYNAYSLVLTFLECQFCIFLFMLKHKKRKLFWLRFIGCVAAGIVLSVAISLVNSEITGKMALFARVLCYNAVSSLNLATLFLCYKESPSEIMLCWCSGMAVYQFSNKFYPFIQNLCGINDKESLSLFHPQGYAWYDWLIFFAVHLCSQIGLSLIFNRKDFINKDKDTTKYVVTASVTTMVFVNVVICIARVYENESMMLNLVVKVFTMGFGIAILIISKNIFLQNKQKQEMSIIRELWHQERLQFKSIKANIDFINSKCHDLKHVFAKFEDKMNSAEIEEIRQAMEFYDKTVKTGNDILDVVLFEKIVLCEKYDIVLSVLADGSKLDVLSASQMYSLFSNIIDNAITSLRKLEDKEKRIITLTVKNGADGIAIEEYNYFEGEISFANGLPQTQKEDKNKHGYGLKSMRYIAERHGGTLTVSADNNIFDVLVKLPYAASDTAKTTKTDTSRTPQRQT